MRIPEPLRPYLPDFHYVLCDLAALAEADIRGAVQLRATLLVMKYIGDERLAERLPGIFTLLRGLLRQRTVVGYLETLLEYLATAGRKLSEDDLRRAVQVALPTLELVSRKFSQFIIGTQRPTADQYR